MYLKNLQKDVIGIVDNNNNVMVKYYYNAYGQIVNVVDTSGISLSTINPFRYRSYYQDDETGWYYLNSRYYDSKCHRFITMDDIDYLGDSESVLSYNLYSYCENNPVNNIDLDGHKKVKLSSKETLIWGIVGLVFNLLKYKIITEHDLSKYLTVDEGIDNRLKKVINEVTTIDELIEKTKSKRYTYNRIKRMLMHILIGLTKEDKNALTKNEYIRILGLNKLGQEYLNSIKKEVNLPIVTKITSVNSIIKDYELKCAYIYTMLTNDNVIDFELQNKPIR